MSAQAVAAAVISLVLLASAFVASAGSDAPTPPDPIWPDQWSQDFTETTKGVLGATYVTTGTYYYDFATKRARTDRASGYGDRYCGGVKYISKEACTHLVLEGKRYLVWPDSQDCCMCCDAEHGCGVLRPDWLKGAKYVGREDVANVTADKWLQRGLQDNFWWQTPDGAVPVQLLQQPNSLTAYDVASYRSGPEAVAQADLFELPPYCSADKTCPLFSICTVVMHAPSLLRR